MAIDTNDEPEMERLNMREEASWTIFDKTITRIHRNTHFQVQVSLQWYHDGFHPRRGHTCHVGSYKRNP